MPTQVELSAMQSSKSSETFAERRRVKRRATSLAATIPRINKTNACIAKHAPSPLTANPGRQRAAPDGGCKWTQWTRLVHALDAVDVVDAVDTVD